MTTPANGKSRRGLVWAIVGGTVLLVGATAIIIASIASPQPSPALTAPTVTDSSPRSAKPTESASVDVVDASVADRGWVPEPITTNAEFYARAALAAASTFDTQLSTRSEWLAYLDTWFTPDTRYTSATDREADMAASQLELRQGVVLPEAEWNFLANEDGRVTATVSGDIVHAEVPDNPSGDMKIATADVLLTFTRLGGGSEASYEETVRVSVQILCGSESRPTPDTAQRPGDCKVIRYFSGSVES